MKTVRMASLLLLASASLGVVLAADANPPASQTAVVPAQWNKPASAFLIAAGSTSPDGRYAIAYPKGDDDGTGPGLNFVVALKPFRVLTVLDDDGVIAGSKRLSLTAEWTANSSEVIATTKHDKWDMIVGSSLVVIQDGQVVKRVNLLNAINREMEPDFRKSKAEAYNDMLPFILTESKLAFDGGGKSIRVKTEAANDPNEARNIEWTAKFDGVWNVADGKWLTRKVSSHAKKNPITQ